MTKVAYQYRIVIVRVVDGDTFIADVDLGFRVWLRGQRFRMARINAPEMSTPEGQVSKAWFEDKRVKQLIEPATIVSKKQDDYGRWLCELYAWNDVNVNDLMVKEGVAKYVKGIDGVLDH